MHLLHPSELHLVCDQARTAWDQSMTAAQQAFLALAVSGASLPAAMTDGSTRLNKHKAAAAKAGKDASWAVARIKPPARSGSSRSIRSWKPKDFAPAAVSQASV